jgi:hypothetical protein
LSRRALAPDLLEIGGASSSHDLAVNRFDTLDTSRRE